MEEAYASVWHNPDLSCSEEIAATPEFGPDGSVVIRNLMNQVSRRVASRIRGNCFSVSVARLYADKLLYTDFAGSDAEVAVRAANKFIHRSGHYNETTRPLACVVARFGFLKGLLRGNESPDLHWFPAIILEVKVFATAQHGFCALPLDKDAGGLLSRDGAAPIRRQYFWIKLVQENQVFNSAYDDDLITIPEQGMEAYRVKYCTASSVRLLVSSKEGLQPHPELSVRLDLAFDIILLSNRAYLWLEHAVRCVDGAFIKFNDEFAWKDEKRLRDCIVDSTFKSYLSPADPEPDATRLQVLRALEWAANPCSYWLEMPLPLSPTDAVSMIEDESIRYALEAALRHGLRQTMLRPDNEINRIVDAELEPFRVRYGLSAALYMGRPEYGPIKKAIGWLYSRHLHYSVRRWLLKHVDEFWEALGGRGGMLEGLPSFSGQWWRWPSSHNARLQYDPKWEVALAIANWKIEDYLSTVARFDGRVWVRDSGKFGEALSFERLEYNIHMSSPCVNFPSPILNRAEEDDFQETDPLRAEAGESFFTPEGLAEYSRPEPRLNMLHHAWAQHYDEIMKLSYGPAYQDLTNFNLNMVGEYFERNDILFRRTEIVDFGAGTGRLSLPLAELGYNVTAVDASEAMLRQLKSRDTEGRVTCVTSPIESYVDPGCHLRGGNGFADLAICFFTVLSYITDRGKLYDALSHMMNTLREDGSMIIECAMPDLFKNKEFQAPGFHRSISFIRVGESAEGQLYDYRDITRYTPAGGPSVRHDESFQLRCWTRETFLELFAELELEIVETRNTPGSIYWTLKHDPGA